MIIGPTQHQAERDALDLLSKTWVDDNNMLTIPVDPVVIAEELGIDVVRTTLPPNVSAAIEVTPGNDPQILLERMDAHVRQRFSCAHELGHYVRNAHRDEFGYIDYRGSLASQGVDLEEIYANTFAAALLMPAAAVKHFLGESETVASLAALFGVSSQAMSIRLDFLGLDLPGRQSA